MSIGDEFKHKKDGALGKANQARDAAAGDAHRNTHGRNKQRNAHRK